MSCGLGTGEACLAMNNDGNEEKTQDDLQEYNAKTNRDGEDSTTTKRGGLCGMTIIMRRKFCGQYCENTE